MTAPLVSICVPNLNKRPYLPERMESLLAQTLTDWELIVGDSFSDDGSWEFFQKFKGDPRVHLHQITREGLYAGWNECVRRARSEFIYMATSDDTADPTLLTELVQALTQHPDALMATCDCRLIDETGAPQSHAVFGTDNRRAVYGEWLLRHHRRHGLSEFVASCAQGTTWGSITAVLMRRELLTKVGLFPAGKPALADFEWGLRACLATDTVHVGECLATLRVYPEQSSAQVDWAQGAWVHAQMVRHTIREFATRLPASLQTPSAEDALAHSMETRAFNALQLYPRTFLHQPLRTLQNLGRGLYRQPALTCRHLSHGARWRNRPTVDLKQHIETLLQEFGLPPVCSPL